jgi:uncharacterized protein YecE (DUF72 family)
MEQVWIGTSGWVYKHWSASFYPPTWPKKDEFEFYTAQFPTVEINATFYRLPTESMVRGWYNKAPNQFLFAVKGSRFITHIKRLSETGLALDKYFDRIGPLRDRLGPVLWQLPPNYEKKPENVDRLERFLEAVPKRFRHAVEFRHHSWVEDSTFDLLRRHNAAHVWLSSGRMPANTTVTADFVYLRFHGLENGAAHDYTKEELHPWATELIKAAQDKKPCFVYFNNDWNTRAPLNAKALMQMVGDLAVEPFAAERELPTRPRRQVSPGFSQPRSKRQRKLPRSS